ncbi:MAG: class I adenylate-forming enzyme family protein [Desulfatiglandales bacterium]
MKMNDESNIYAVFEATAERRRQHTAIIYLGTRYSYLKVKELAERFAAALVDLGVTGGQRVVLYIPNTVQWVVTWLGIQRAGAVPVPITPIYTPYDLRYIANDSEAEAVVCADTNFGYVKRVLPETKLKNVIVTRMADLLPWWKRCFGALFDIIPKGKIALEEQTYSLRALLSKHKGDEKRLPPLERNGRARAEILYTGGTTKFPKGVPYTHGLFLVSMAEQIAVSEPLVPVEENVIFGNAPLFHILGQTCSLATLLVGGTLMLQPKVNIDATLEGIERFKATSMIGVPTLYRMMLEHDRIDQYDLSSVVYWYSAGDVLPVEVGKRWREKFGKTIYQGYGATETCGGVAMCPANIDNPPKSVGRVVPSKRVKLVDSQTLKLVKPGEPGELLVHSDLMVTSYLNKPEETAASFVDIDGRTYYRTADVMSVDADGNLFFVDRTVDTIKHKGYRISASEIEAVLQEHPAVIGSCVVGIPDEKVGERIKAYVVLKADIKGITGYDLIKWCRKQLVSYKVPQYIEFRDMLPKSKVGKLLRREIRDEEKRRAEG